ncbi:MAG: hypothetical protein ACOC46_03970 [Pirellulales bacterium]
MGFLGIVGYPDGGLFGGYLVLNPAGRPVEFHCTTPIQPSRAQEILYGPTLPGFLYGEQIGWTLLQEARQPVVAVLTDQPASLAVRDHVDLPVALVISAHPSATGVSAVPRDPGVTGPSPVPREQHGQDVRGTFRAPDEQPYPEPLIEFAVDDQRLAVRSDRADDQSHLVAQLTGWRRRVDLREPFDRIRQAIAEARKTGS